MNVRTFLQTTTGIAAVALTASLIVASSGQGESRGSTFEVTSATIDAGGGTSTSSTYELIGTIGQPDAGPVLAGTSFEVVGGFWMGGPIDTCVTDIANDDGLTNVFDLLALLSDWGTNGAGADIAEPNDVVNVFDLLELLGAWGACS